MLIPEIVNLELTSRCNLNCVFCDHARLRKTMRLGDMDTALLVSILESLEGRRIYELGTVGLGEPALDGLLAEHLAAIAEHAERFIRISMNSNGTVMGEEAARIILASPVNLLTFSLNATNARSYAKLMGKDLFDQAIANIKRFMELRRKLGRDDLNVSVQFMLSDLNLEDEMHALFEGYTDEKVKVYNRFVFNKPALENQRDGELVKVNAADFCRRHPCWSMYSRVYIDIEGNVYACTIGNDSHRGDTGLKMGNVAEASLLELFNSPCMEAARQKAEANQVPFPECADCTLWELFPCNFDCHDGRWLPNKQHPVRRPNLDRKD